MLKRPTLPPEEEERVARIASLLGPRPGLVLDVGARDGRVSMTVANKARHLVALDLRPKLTRRPGLDVVAGDVTALPFPERSFEAVLCTEVLEHVAPEGLDRARQELTRVTSGRLLVTVPFEQDLSVGATRCGACGTVNPPWGHVNSFTVESVVALFPDLEPEEVGTFGTQRNVQPRIAGWIEARLGYPRGAWHQEEGCVACSARLLPPPFPLWKRVAAVIPSAMTHVARWSASDRPNWIYALFRRY